MSDYIPYGRQEITPEDEQAVLAALRSEWLTQGPMIDQFQQAVADYCGTQYATACANGTAALHLACLALDVGLGDIVWTTANTFVASANCALYCGAKVDFVDIDPDTLNMSVDRLVEKLDQAQKNNDLPKVVIPVHFGGLSCDMQKIHALSQKYGFKIIEDASHAIGSKYRAQSVGSCKYADMTTFSFHPVKVITTGEGGMVMTSQSHLAEKLNLLRTHGVTKNPEMMIGQAEGPWYYQQIDLGFNYRITDIQCALGLSQLKRLDDYVARRNQLAQRYNELLQGLPIKRQKITQDSYSAYHLYVIQLDATKTSKTRLDVFNYLRKYNIGVNVHYIPVHLQPYYQQLGFKAGDFPCAEAYYEGAITLPLFPTMTEADQDRVIKALKDALRCM